MNQTRIDDLAVVVDNHRQNCGPLGELDVIHRAAALWTELAHERGLARQGLEELRVHELGGPRSQDRPHGVPVLGQLAREIAGLVQRRRGAGREEDVRHAGLRCSRLVRRLTSARARSRSSLTTT